MKRGLLRRDWIVTQVYRPLKSMDPHFPRSIMFICESLSYLALCNLKSVVWASWKYSIKHPSKGIKLGTWCGGRSAINQIQWSWTVAERTNIYWALKFRVSQNSQQPWKFGDIFPVIEKARNGESEKVSYLSMITQLLSGGARIWSYICSKILLLKQLATNYLCSSCNTQECSINATSSFPSCLLHAISLLFSRLICTSVLSSWSLTD